MRASAGTVPMLALLAALPLVGGCARNDRLVASGPDAREPALASPADASGKPIRTVKPGSAGVRADPSAEAPGPGLGSPFATRTAKEIYDPSPRGDDPEMWRSPFVIAENDGPLTNYVRRTARELREFKAGIGAGPAVAAAQRCGETDVAAAKPGCVKPQGKPSSGLERDPPTIR